MADHPLDAVAALAALIPFRVADVARVVGVELKPDTNATNPYFTIHRARPNEGPWQSVELRTRDAPRAGKDGMLLLDVRSDPCISTDEATKRFGQGSPIIPTPQQPPDSPLYYVYHQPWGELRLGYSRAEPSCLVTIVLDATGS